jgi:hypothetical protein
LQFVADQSLDLCHGDKALIIAGVHKSQFRSGGLARVVEEQLRSLHLHLAEFARQLFGDVLQDKLRIACRGSHCEVATLACRRIVATNEALLDGHIGQTILQILA